LSKAEEVFRACVTAIDQQVLIKRESRNDKEFAFQNWFKKRLQSLNIDFDTLQRNVYPDFRLVHEPQGFELKALAYPGRVTDYDCNSQVPMGKHNGRDVFYVFGRYPKDADGNEYPVLDLVICHGSFMNADDSYEHKNTSFRGFGSYGDIMVRDRKMYVAPTPFALADGTAHRRTLILPQGQTVSPALREVGTLERTEVAEVVTAYSFDLTSNVLNTTLAPNPNAGRVHSFKAYRVRE
jgi:hypothetical protein